MTIGIRILYIFIIFNLIAWSLCFSIGGPFGTMCLVVVPLWNIIPFLASLLLIVYEMLNKKFKLGKSKSILIVASIALILILIMIGGYYWLNYQREQKEEKAFQEYLREKEENQKILEECKNNTPASDCEAYCNNPCDLSNQEGLSKPAGEPCKCWK